MDKKLLLQALPGPATAIQDSFFQDVAAGKHTLLTAPAYSGKSALLAALAAHEESAQVLVVGGSRQHALRAAIQESAQRIKGGSDTGLSSLQVGKVDLVSGFATRLVTEAITSHDRPTIRLAAETETAAWVMEACQDVEWGSSPSPLARQSEQFASELLESVNRARDYNVSATELRTLSKQNPSWAGIATVLENLSQMQDQRRQNSAGGSWALDTNGVLDYLMELLREGKLQVGRDFPSLLVVDDLHEVTAQTLDLLALSASRGTQIVATANPDVATSVFRGGVTRSIQDLQAALSGGRKVAVLHSSETLPSWPADIRDFYHATVSLVETTGTKEIRCQPTLKLPVSEKFTGQISPNLRLLVAKSEASHLEQLVRTLKNLHIDQGVPYSDMALLVRTSSDIDQAKRTLSHFGIPVESSQRATALQKGMLTGPLLRLANRLARGQEPTWDAVQQELTSRLIGLDRWKIDALRVPPSLQMADDPQQTLHPYAWHWFCAGQRAAQDGEKLSGITTALEQAVTNEGNPSSRFPGIARYVAATAWRLGWVWSAVSAGTESGKLGLEQLLWQVWDSLGHAKDWQEEVLNPLTSLARRQQLNEALDQVMDLFKLAQWWAQRNPQSPLTEFLTKQLEAVVPQRVHAPHGRTEPGITLTTPALSAGRHWPVVAVAGVFGRKWPQMTRHDQLLGAAGETLYLAKQGIKPPAGEAWPDQQMQSTWYAEARHLAAALSRASQQLLIGTVNGADQTPSPFLYGIFSRLGAGADTIKHILGQVTSQLEEPSTLGDVLSQLRQETLQTTPSPFSKTSDANAAEVQSLPQAAQTLDWMKNHGYRQADPQTWADYLPPSNPTGKGTETVVNISPSQIQQLISRPLTTVLEQLGAKNTEENVEALKFGTQIHTLAEEVTRKLWPAWKRPAKQYSLQKIQAEVEQIYRSYVQPSGNEPTWLERVQENRVQRIIRNLTQFLHENQFRSLCEYRWRVSEEPGYTPPIPVRNFHSPQGEKLAVTSNMSMDRVMFDDETETLYIVDYKTGKAEYHTTDLVNTNLQMAFYQLIAESQEFRAAFTDPDTFFVSEDPQLVKTQKAKISNLTDLAFRVKQVQVMIVPLEQEEITEKSPLRVIQKNLDAPIKIPHQNSLSEDAKKFLTNPGIPPVKEKSQYWLQAARSANKQTSTESFASEQGEGQSAVSFLDDKKDGIILRDYLLERLGIAATIKSGDVFPHLTGLFNKLPYSLQTQEW